MNVSVFEEIMSKKELTRGEAIGRALGVAAAGVVVVLVELWFVSVAFTALGVPFTLLQGLVAVLLINWIAVKLK